MHRDCAADEVPPTIGRARGSTRSSRRCARRAAVADPAAAVRSGDGGPAVVVHQGRVLRRGRPRQGLYPRRRCVPGRAVAAVRRHRPVRGRSTSTARCARSTLRRMFHLEFPEARVTGASPAGPRTRQRQTASAQVVLRESRPRARRCASSRGSSSSSGRPTRPPTT
jgi:hypothetical protein